MSAVSCYLYFLSGVAAACVVLALLAFGLFNDDDDHHDGYNV